MANKNEKSQAELYREERKARQAKIAKKREKKSPKRIAMEQKLVKAIPIVIAAVAVVFAIGWFLNFMGVPQRMTTVMTVGDTKSTRRSIHTTTNRSTPTMPARRSNMRSMVSAAFRA